MTELPKPPKMHGDFIERYPELGRAWSLIAEAGRNGPLDERTARLVKLGVAMAALRDRSRVLGGRGNPESAAECRLRWRLHRRGPVRSLSDRRRYYGVSHPCLPARTRVGGRRPSKSAGHFVTVRRQLAKVPRAPERRRLQWVCKENDTRCFRLASPLKHALRCPFTGSP